MTSSWGCASLTTNEHARSFAELVARVVLAAIPEIAMVKRNTALRKGRVYVDYLQLGHGKTIAAPFAVPPIAGAPVSAPIGIAELKAGLDPASFTIRNLALRMKRLKLDPLCCAQRSAESRGRDAWARARASRDRVQMNRA
ncbi:MAG TPA: hypothetical protein VGI47_04615 [Candidatus Binataceae bacterium]